MNLHEQYDTLHRRGMPEHPRLHLCDGLWSLHESVEEYGDDGALDDADARDLLTMHALRWWLKALRKGCPWSDTESGPSDRAITLEAGEGQGWIGYATNHLDDSWKQISRSIDPLDAIVAATAHMETK